MESRYMPLLLFPTRELRSDFFEMKKPKERFCWGGGCYKLSDEQKSGKKKEEKQTSNRNDVLLVGDVQHGSFSFPKMMPMEAA